VLDATEGVEYGLSADIGSEVSRPSNTSAARATTRASLTIFADSSLLSEPSFFRLAKVRSGIPTAAASSACVSRIVRAIESTESDGIPWRITCTHCNGVRGDAFKPRRPPSNVSAETIAPMVSLPYANWRP
jgi:hypothetical protein